MGNIITKILWGKSFIKAKDAYGNIHPFILRSLTIKEQNQANWIYDEELGQAQQIGILTLDQMTRLYDAQGTWTQDDEKHIEDIEKEIRMIKKRIRDSEFVKVRKKQLMKQLDKKKKELQDKQSEKLNLFYLCAEHRAEEVKRRYIVYLSTETINEHPFWLSYEDFAMEDDATLIQNLAIAYIKNNYMEEKELRQIARSNEWRYRWEASKKGESLFGNPISEWSELQNSLVFWSQYYDGVYSSPDRPAQHVIDNDEALDAWVEEQNKKYANSKVGKDIGGKTKDHAEHFIMVGSDAESAKQVQELNPESVRNQLRREYDQIKNSKGRVKEWHLGNRKFSTERRVVRK